MGMNGDGRVRFRLSTAEEWANINPILDDGEPGCVRSGSMLLMKIGDGVTPWNELGYFGTNPLDIYPVGSIYTSTVNVSPETLFGGKWEKMPAGRVLVAEGTYTENGKTFNFTAGSTGGEAEHQLTIGELPTHSHTRGTMNIAGRITLHGSEKPNIFAGLSGAFYDSMRYENEYRTPVDLTLRTATTVSHGGATFDASRSWTGETSYVGANNSHNNLPPFLAVFCWKRIS